MLPMETRFTLFLWKPKPSLSQFPTLINGNQRRQKDSCSGSWAAGAEVTPTSHEQRDPIARAGMGVPLSLLRLTASAGTGGIRNSLLPTSSLLFSTG